LEGRPLLCIDHVLARNDPDHDFGTVAAVVERMGVPDHCRLELRGKSCRRHPVRDTAALGAPLVVGVILSVASTKRYPVIIVVYYLLTELLLVFRGLRDLLPCTVSPHAHAFIHHTTILEFSHSILVINSTIPSIYTSIDHEQFLPYICYLFSYLSISYQLAITTQW